MENLKISTNQKIAQTIIEFLRKGKEKYCAIPAIIQESNNCISCADVFLVSQDTLKSSGNLKSLYIATNFHKNENECNMNLTESHTFTFAGYYVVSEDAFVDLQYPLLDILKSYSCSGNEVAFNILSLSHMKEEALRKMNMSIFEEGRKILEETYEFDFSLPIQKNMEKAIYLFNPKKPVFFLNALNLFESKINDMVINFINVRYVKNLSFFKENIRESDFIHSFAFFQGISKDSIPLVILSYFDNETFKILKNKVVKEIYKQWLIQIVGIMLAYKTCENALIEKNSFIYKKIVINSAIFDLKNKTNCWITIKNKSKETMEFKIALSALQNAYKLDHNTVDKTESLKFLSFIGEDDQGTCSLKDIIKIKNGKKIFSV